MHISAFDVPRGKPAPHGFLEAARQLGHALPRDYVLIEDAVPGVMA